jgi:hypothetical protein
MAKRVFTDAELKELGARTIDLLKQAIAAGDQKKAGQMADRWLMESQAIHDLYLHWIASLMSYIYTRSGEDALYQAMREFYEACGMPDPSEGDFRSNVEGVAMVLRAHLVPLKVEEDDEKVTVTMQPCGSGEKLLKTGKYAPPYNFAMIQKPHPMTWGKTNFPSYCVHAPIMEIMSIEKYGYTMSPCVPAENVAESSCRHRIYKNPADIPEDVYTRVGMKKPKKIGKP